MIRFLGAGMIMGAAIWFSMYFAVKEKYRLQELEELERGMLYLQGQITYLSAPLAQAMAVVGRKMNGQTGIVFRKIAEKLDEQKEPSAEAVWNGVWQEEGRGTFLSAEDLDIILHFGKSLGYLDRTQQENSIRLLLRYIEEALGQGRKRMEKNGRLYYGVGCLSGLLIIVTLL